MGVQPQTNTLCGFGYATGFEATCTRRLRNYFHRVLVCGVIENICGRVGLGSVRDRSAPIIVDELNKTKKKWRK
jgi:hypothetical protein